MRLKSRDHLTHGHFVRDPQRVVLGAGEIKHGRVVVFVGDVHGDADRAALTEVLVRGGHDHHVIYRLYLPV